MALSNPIKFFNAHDKKSEKSQEDTPEVSSTDTFIYLPTQNNCIPLSLAQFKVTNSRIHAIKAEVTANGAYQKCLKW